MNYSEDVFAADGDPNSSVPAERIPRVSDEAKDYIAKRAKDLDDELLELMDLFRIPLSNNVPFFEDNDPDKPVYHIVEYLEMIEYAFKRHGWMKIPDDNSIAIDDDETKGDDK